MLLDLELEIPDYMSSLDQHTIDTISLLPDKDRRIISCGVFGDRLQLITGSGHLREISKNGKTIPISACPISSGECIVLELLGRGEKIISSDVVVKYSKNSLNNLGLFVNNSYVCEVEVDDYKLPQEHNED